MLVRKDLSPAQQAVQAAHAALEVGRSLHSDRVHPHLVVCGVNSQAQLENALSKVQALGIKCHPFVEPDIGGQLTAFATEPLSGEARRHFRRYNLLVPSLECIGGAA